MRRLGEGGTGAGAEACEEPPEGWESFLSEPEELDAAVVQDVGRAIWP